MKYKLIGDNYTFIPIDTIFNNRGIRNKDEILNLDRRVEESYKNYKNMDRGVELYVKHLEQKSKIVFAVDCDCDGYTSAGSLYMYTKTIYPDSNIIYMVHRDKMHGLTSDIVIDEDTDLIVMTDASSNDYERHKYYHDLGIDILVLDHHEVEYESEYATVINNQLSPNVENKNLSGVGVVYKFLQALDDKFKINESSKYLDLVALGNVGDSMDLTEKETRYYVYQGLFQINNRFIQEVMELNTYQLEGKFNITSLGWVIAPKINCVVRSGTQEDKIMLFEALINLDKYYDYKPRGKDKVKEHITKYMARKCNSIKTKQDKQTKEGLALIEDNINNLDNKYIIHNTNNKLGKSYTGLVANKLQSKYKVPVLLYSEKENGNLGGSARGNKDIIDDFKALLNDSELFVFCEGHPNSFGFEFRKENLNVIKNYLKEKLKDIKVVNEKIYDVDLVLETQEIEGWLVDEISEYENEWGNGIEEPLIVFKDITINSENVRITDSRPKNIIFKYNNIEFIKKYATNNLADEFKDYYGNIKLTIIGKCKKKYYKNYVNSQVEIVDFEMEVA